MEEVLNLIKKYIELAYVICKVNSKIGNKNKRGCKIDLSLPYINDIFLKKLNIDVSFESFEDVCLNGGKIINGLANDIILQIQQLGKDERITFKNILIGEKDNINNQIEEYSKLKTMRFAFNSMDDDTLTKSNVNGQIVWLQYSYEFYEHLISYMNGLIGVYSLK